MTDLNKEREAFIQTEFNTFGLDVNDFKTTGEYFMFIGWLMRSELEKAKAQAVPEGYVLMPKVPTEKMFQAYERYSVAPMSTLSKTGYKAMVEAAGDQNENS
ncbi:hypothetical protein [Acinetobacter nosocomialis]|uniref:hypothetical protein n=1 Tax=Acinetobacter nosocomialis TaxID=106654 RepID=UPI0031D9D003